MPASWIPRFGEALGLACYQILLPEKKRVMGLLKDAFPEKSPDEIQRLFVQTVRNAGRVTVEKFMANREYVLACYRSLAGMDRTAEVLRQFVASGRGFILLTTHMANPEYSLAFVARYLTTTLGTNVCVMAAHMPTRYLENVTREVRHRMDVDYVLVSKAKYYVKRILSQKGGVLFGLDVDHGPRGVFVPFLHRPMSIAGAPAYYSLRYDVPMAVLKLYFDRSGVQHLEVEPVQIERTGDMQRDVERLTAKAARSIAELIRRHPEQWYGWVQRPWSTRPLEELEERLAKNPRDTDALTRMAALHLARGKTADAIETLHRALEIEPACQKAHAELGRIYREGNEPEKALHHLEKALRIWRSDPASSKQMGLLLLGLKRPERALKYFLRAIWVKYDDPQSYWGLGQCLEQLGKTRWALHTYRKGVRLNQQYGPLHEALALLYAGRKDRKGDVARHLFAMKELSYDSQKVLERIAAAGGEAHG